MFKYMYNILQLGFSIGWYLYQDCLPSITESWRRTCRWRLHEPKLMRIESMLSKFGAGKNPVRIIEALVRFIWNKMRFVQ